MSIYVQIHNHDQTNTEIISVEHQDYVEDKFISLCNELESIGIHTLEIASGMMFVTHYLLSQKDNKEAEKYYKYLAKQCQNQIEALHEFYEIPTTQKSL
ncbi:MAG: hypothetical protein ACRBCK_07910 [Alphaproteobacteria bacterium]